MNYLIYISKMTKQESIQLKGVAICMMLFLHLFNNMDNVLLCDTSLSLFGKPLVYRLTRITSPVPFFLILSGYGLYSSYLTHKGGVLIRLMKLYIHYWVVLILFVGLGSILDPSRYPGSLCDVVNNITGWKTTYNGENWFLFPYVLLSLVSVSLFRFIDRNKNWVVGVAGAVVFLLTYGITDWYSAFLYEHQFLNQLILSLYLLFPFVLGVLLKRCCAPACIKKKISKYSLNTSVLVWVAMVLLLVVKVNLPGIANPFYAILFVLLYTRLRLPQWVNSFFYHLGEHSMTMWFIHTYLCYYLFHDFIYGFKYPILIFGVLLILSYFLSDIVNRICKPIIRLLPQKNVTLQTKNSEYNDIAKL